MDEWCSIKYQKPDNKPVLAYCLRTDEIVIATWNEVDGWELACDGTAQGMKFEAEHWMPLPDKPERK